MKELKILLKKLAIWFNKLNHRERLLVGSAFAFCVFYSLLQVVTFLDDYQEESSNVLKIRKNDYIQIAKISQRYETLKNKKDNIQNEFNKSQMTFDEVTSEVDKIVQQAIGESKYELTKPHPPTPFGFEYQKQDFILSVRTLNLEQLTRLLYQIENGGKPLYLNRLNISRLSNANTLSAIFEIYSIGKSQQTTSKSST